MARWAPMIPAGRGSGNHCLRILVAWVVLLVSTPATAQEDYPDGLPDWLFSIGSGVSFFSRDVDGLSDGIVLTDNTSASNCDADGFCTFFDKDTRAVDGMAIPLSGQLMGPPWEDGWGRPRLLAQGGYGWPLKDRVVSEVGSSPNDFDTNGLEADVRLRLTGEPDHFWWAGGGVAFQLPVHRYPVWLKLTVNYLEEETNVVGRVDQKVGVDKVTKDLLIGVTKAEHDLTIRHIAPALGLEALFARMGPVALGISGDFMFGIPLGSTDKKFVVEAPGVGADPGKEPDGGPVTFRYDGDSPWFWGGLTLRLVWVGFDD